MIRISREYYARFLLSKCFIGNKTCVKCDSTFLLVKRLEGFCWDAVSIPALVFGEDFDSLVTEARQLTGGGGVFFSLYPYFPIQFLKKNISKELTIKQYTLSHSYFVFLWIWDYFFNFFASAFAKRSAITTILSWYTLWLLTILFITNWLIIPLLDF